MLICTLRFEQLTNTNCVFFMAVQVRTRKPTTFGVCQDEDSPEYFVSAVLRVYWLTSVMCPIHTGSWKVCEHTV